MHSDVTSLCRLQSYRSTSLPLLWHASSYCIMRKTTLLWEPCQKVVCSVSARASFISICYSRGKSVEELCWQASRYCTKKGISAWPTAFKKDSPSYWSNLFGFMQRHFHNLSFVYWIAQSYLWLHKVIVFCWLQLVDILIKPGELFFISWNNMEQVNIWCIF